MIEFDFDPAIGTAAKLGAAAHAALVVVDGALVTARAGGLAVGISQEAQAALLIFAARFERAKKDLQAVIHAADAIAEAAAKERSTPRLVLPGDVEYPS